MPQNKLSNRRAPSHQNKENVSNRDRFYAPHVSFSESINKQYWIQRPECSTDNSLLARAVFGHGSRSIFSASAASSSTHVRAASSSQPVAQSIPKKGGMKFKQNITLEYEQNDDYSQSFYWTQGGKADSGFIIYSTGFLGRDLSLYSVDKNEAAEMKSLLHRGRITALSQMPYDGNLLVGNINGSQTIYDLQRQESVLIQQHHCELSVRRHKVTGIQPYHDYGHLVGSICGQVFAFDDRAGKGTLFSIPLAQSNGENSFPCDIKFKNHQLCVGTNNNGWMVYDDRKIISNINNEYMYWHFPSTDCAVTSFDFHPQNDDLLAVGFGSENDGINLYSLKTFKLIDIYYTNAAVSCVQWAGDLKSNPVLLGGLGDGANSVVSLEFHQDKLKHIDTQTKHSEKILGLSRNWDGRFFATRGADKQVNIWKTHNETTQEEKQRIGQKSYSIR